MITKRTKVMLVVLVLVAIGAYAYLYWWSKTPDHGVFDYVPAIREASDSASKAVIRPTTGTGPVATTTNPGTDGTPEVPSTSYRTFENSEFSFSFAYPDNWEVSQSQANGKTSVCVTTEGGTGGCLVTVMLEKESVNVSAEKSLAALQTEFRAGTIAESSRRVGGEEADVLKVSGYPADSNADTRAAVFTKDQMVYVITGAKGQEAVFDRALDSFLFRM